MDLNIQRLNDAHVRYLLIGGQAMRLEGMPRFSMDWDFFIPKNDLPNFDRINDALDEVLDTPVVSLGPGGEGFVQTYQTMQGIMQFHLAPVGIDSFDAAEERSVIRHTENGTQVHCLCPQDLLKCKEATARPQDLDDIAFLRIKLGYESRT